MALNPNDYTITRVLSDEPLSVLGFQQLTSLGTAAGFTVPTGATRAIVTVEAQPVRLRDDGTNPTSTIGHILAVGIDITFSGDLTKPKFIETAASAKLNVSYYG